MEKIKQFFKKYVGTDGLLHILSCAVITLSCGYFFNPFLAFFLSVFSGFAKEIIWDGWMRKGTFELKDLVCDLAGAFSGFCIVLAAYYLMAGNMGKIA